MRHGFGTPNESYINVLAGVDSLRNLDVWVAGVGDIAQWYARGKPISKAFSTAHGYNDRHELLSSGVRLARVTRLIAPPSSAVVFVSRAGPGPRRDGSRRAPIRVVRQA